MNTVVVALLAVVSGVDPVAEPVQRAVEARLARLAVEMEPGSLKRAQGPEAPPYRWFTYRDVRARQLRGLAVSDGGEVVVSGDAASLGRFFETTQLLERKGAADALEAWRQLAQVEPILDRAAVAKLAPEDQKAVFPARRDGARVTGFFRQGDEIFQVQLDVEGAKTRVALKPLGEILGRDELDEAIHALGSPDEIVRAAAAFELAEKKDDRAFPALVAALADRSANVRETVARGLSRQVALEPAKKPQALAALRKAQARELDPGAKGALAEALEALEPKAKGR